MTEESAGGLEENILTFEDGIPGFPDHSRWVLVDPAQDSAFQILQSADDRDVAMIVTVPWLFFTDYSPELTDIEQRELEIERPEDAVIFCPVTLGDDQDTIFINLLGPFVVNSRTRRGRQLVLSESGYPARTQLSLAQT
jgi:flagellar assembly factor FliW